MNGLSTWLTALILLLFATMVAIAFQFPPEARLAPLIIGVPGMLLCLLQLGLDVAGASSGRLGVLSFRVAPRLGTPGENLDRQGDFGPGTASRELIIWLYFAAFIAGVLIFGFYVAVPVMLVAFLHFETRFSLPRALLAGVGATAILYAAFGTVLQIRLHHGFVMHLLGA